MEVPAGPAHSTVFVMASFFSSGSSQASGFTLTLRQVDPATADATQRDCATRPPWNRSFETAVTLPLGAPLPNQKICHGVTGRYFWKIPGPFNASDLIQLQATLDANSGDADFDVGTLFNGVYTLGNVVTPMGCATGGSENCTTGLSNAQATWDAAYVRGYLFNAMDTQDGSLTLQAAHVAP